MTPLTGSIQTLMVGLCLLMLLGSVIIGLIDCVNPFSWNLFNQTSHFVQHVSQMVIFLPTGPTSSLWCLKNLESKQRRHCVITLQDENMRCRNLASIKTCWRLTRLKSTHVHKQPTQSIGSQVSPKVRRTCFIYRLWWTQFATETNGSCVNVIFQLWAEL